MRVVLSWLRELCPTELSAEDIAERLTTQGVKVESIIRPWERLSGVLVARVLEVRDHPNSDKLCLTRVSYGSGERELVVGVRNMREGDLVPLAGPGATVPGLPEPLATLKLRGVVSDGMLCSGRELGISGDHLGILILPPESTVGADFKSEYGLDEAVFDIEVKSNRPDLLSVAGVAREVAAATGTPFSLGAIDPAEAGEKADEAATVDVVDLGRCPRYLARVLRGVSIGPSPVRVQARLMASGMRPLSNVVDATNYVMLEMGQPLHAFDLDRLEGGAVIVRRAIGAETIVTLDEVPRLLTEEDLVIADRAKEIAIAGIMGSASAEVSHTTSDVLIESAHFQPRGVLRTARRLGLRTEASIRFERGTDPEAVDWAADRSARLMAEWAGGTVLAGRVGVGGAPERRRVSVRADRASLVLGYRVTPQDVRLALERLGLGPSEPTGEPPVVEAEIPGYRWDLQREEDLIEEVARFHGYDRVPITLPAVRQAGGAVHPYERRRRIREALSQAGLREALSYSFASPTDLELMDFEVSDAVRVANPLASDQEFLRTSLVPGLLRAGSHNVSRGVRGVALFEVGNVFRYRTGELPEESERVAMLVCGTPWVGFPGETRETDFFDAKGAVEALMSMLRVSAWHLGEPAPAPWHPARSAAVIVGDDGAGWIGELHPRLAERLELPGRTAVVELQVASLAARANAAFSYRDLPRFPPVRRDLAFVVGEDLPAGAVTEALLRAGGELLQDAVLFDVFTGPPIPAGKKSLAFSVDFRAPDRTLTDAEADVAVRAIVARLARDFGAELRTG